MHRWVHVNLSSPIQCKIVGHNCSLLSLYCQRMASWWEYQVHLLPYHSLIHNIVLHVYSSVILQSASPRNHQCFRMALHVRGFESKFLLFRFRMYRMIVLFLCSNYPVEGLSYNAGLYCLELSGTPNTRTLDFSFRFMMLDSYFYKRFNGWIST